MKVSVAMITYNHEAFIGQAIESVLMQKVAFDYEIVIGEDCSTDRTREIVLGFHKKYPEKIRLLLNAENEGARANFIQVLTACKAEFVALLDGDDFWTSPLKLQRQVDFLDHHPECSICFHSVIKLYEDGLCEESKPPGQRSFYDVRDLLLDNFIATSSTLYRNRLFGEFPDWFKDDTLGIGDKLLHILNAEHGSIGYINETMSTYRRHVQGVSVKTDVIEVLERSINMYGFLSPELTLKYRKTINQGLFKKYILLARAYARRRNKMLARRSIRKGISVSPLSEAVFCKEFYLAIFHLYLPRLFSLLARRHDYRRSPK